MIDINKKYRTRDGREVRIYATDGIGQQCVQGAFLSKEGGWSMWLWSKNGLAAICSIGELHMQDMDLVEVKPRIKRTVWLNVYAREDRPTTKKEADELAASTRLACVKVEIDVEEGHGL